MIKVAIDAIGGDFGSKPIIEGVLNAMQERDFHPFLVGPKEEIEKLIPEKYFPKITIVNASDVLSMQDSATDVFKRKDSSIYKAIELVRLGECDTIVSAGHSGATMSLATVKIGRLKNVLRPPLATLMPSLKPKKTLVLDVGANVDCKPSHLFGFAVMGGAYATEIMGIKNPRIGLLSNGEEDSKGNEVAKETFTHLKMLKNFIGNVEGNQIFDGSVDVVICDGFVGNILLKTSEGVASAMYQLIKQEAKKSFCGIFGGIMMKKVFKTVKKNTDYDEYGGAPLLGVNNCVIISHGKSNPKAIKNAIFQALDFTNSNISSVIETKLGEFNIK